MSRSVCICGGIPTEHVLGVKGCLRDVFGQPVRGRKAKPAASRGSFRGDGDPHDRCLCGHERDVHLTRECVGCSDSSGCSGFRLRPKVDRAAMKARIVADLDRLSDFDLEQAEYRTAGLARRFCRHPETEIRPTSGPEHEEDVSL